MHIRDFEAMPEAQVTEFLMALSPDEQDDFHDGLLFPLAEYRDREDRRYFDDLDEYIDYLVKHTRIVDGPEVIRRHELAHAQCAEMLGAVSVKYYTRIIRVGSSTIETGAYTNWFGPIDLPNLAFAAVPAAPKRPSVVDMREITSRSGYRDLGYLRERIEKWNSDNHALKIPLPGELEI